MSGPPLEYHPFGAYVPAGASTLILGSFPGRHSTQPPLKTPDPEDWFYRAPRNQFWPILERISGQDLQRKAAKARFLQQSGIALADVLAACRRRRNSNQDSALADLIPNGLVYDLVGLDSLRQVCFISRQVEHWFWRFFGEAARSLPLDYRYLPSPSPAYFRMSLEEKAAVYRQVLGL